MTSETTDTVPNSLAEKVVTCKAIRAYAHAMKKPLASVSQEDVAKSKLGIKGYAELYATMPDEIQSSFPQMDGSNNQAFARRDKMLFQKPEPRRRPGSKPLKSRVSAASLAGPTALLILNQLPKRRRRRTRRDPRRRRR